MIKKVIRSVVIFWGIATAIFPPCYLVYAHFTVGSVLYEFLDTRGRHPLVSATAWLDDNANGIQDPGEKALANVCIGWGEHAAIVSSDGPDAVSRILDLSYNFQCKAEQVIQPVATDEEGKWGGLVVESCQNVFIFARVPEGYQATTDLASANGCVDAKFGFAPVGVQVKQKIDSVEQFIQREIVILWVKRIAIGMIILLAGIFGTIWLQKDS
jgi:hypothetical protein